MTPPPVPPSPRLTQSNFTFKMSGITCNFVTFQIVVNPSLVSSKDAGSLGWSFGLTLLGLPLENSA